MSELKYTKDHEWIRVEGDSAVIGVTAFAAEQLGDVVYVDLPDVDDEIEAGSEMGEIESTKSVSDLLAPISGTVTEVNEEVVDEPEKVNQDPLGDGWLIKASFEELPEDLLSEDEYKTFIQE